MPTAAAESKECRDNVSSSGPLPGLSLHLIHICWLTLVLKQFPYYQTVVVVGTCFLSFLHFFFSSFSYHCPSSHLPLLSLTRKVYRNHTDLCPLCWLMFNPLETNLLETVNVTFLPSWKISGLGTIHSMSISVFTILDRCLQVQEGQIVLSVFPTSPTKVNPRFL